MVSKNQIKLITSLHQKKFRQIHQRFIAEGVKVIDELLNAGFELEYLYQTEPVFAEPNPKIFFTTATDLKKISALTVPNNCLAVFKMPQTQKIIDKGLVLALDDIRDPGNLGTIIRLCDWFGIKQLICSEQTVDLFNPKVVQSTMGSIARVQVHYVDLSLFIAQSSLPVFGTFMDGDSIYTTHLPENGIIIMGNEANGISTEIQKKVTQRLTIPRFGDLQQAESLNVASATAIILSEFSRRNGINGM